MIGAFTVNLLLRECHRTSLREVNTGSGNGLVPSGNKPLPEPMLIQSYAVTGRPRLINNKLTLVMLVFSEKQNKTKQNKQQQQQKHICIFDYFSKLRWNMRLRSSHTEDTDLPISHTKEAWLLMTWQCNKPGQQLYGIELGPVSG